MTVVLDLLRLEVERPRDPDELVNLVANPSGDLGAWGWVTPVAGSVLRSVSVGGVRHLEFTSPGGVATRFVTEAMPVAAGRHVAATWTAPAVASRYSVRLEWLRADKTVLSATAASAVLAASSDRQVYGTFQAPTATVYVRLRVDHYSNGSAANPDAGSTLRLREVTVTDAATSTVLRSVRTNLITNPSGETNANGWSTQSGASVVSSAEQAWVGSRSLAFSRSAGRGYLVGLAAGVAVTPGRDYAIQARFRPRGTLRKPTLSVRWLNSSGGRLGDDVQLAKHSEVAGTWSPVCGGVATAPLRAISAQLIVKWGEVSASETHYVDAAMIEQASSVLSYFSGATASGGGVTYAWSGTANTSTSTATTGPGDVGVLSPRLWQNVAASVTESTINREEMTPGQLDVTLRDPLLDPSENDLIRPGRRVRLTAVDGDSVITGKIVPESIDVTYDLLANDPGKRTKVTFTVVDDLARLAASSRPEGVATIDELPFVLEGCGVPWSVNGSGDQTPTAEVVTYNSNATAVDQIVVTRDTAMGLAWIDRDGVMNVWGRAELSTDIAATLDESVYGGDLVSGFDPNSCVNSVEVVVMSVVATSGAVEEVRYGPYRDEGSIAEYDVRPGVYTVQGPDWDEAAALAYATRVLAANAFPRRRVRSVTLNITSPEDFGLALLDLQDRVQIANERAGISEISRVTSVQHRITGSSWVVTLAFAGESVIAPPVAVSRPPSVQREVRDDAVQAAGASAEQAFEPTKMLVETWTATGTDMIDVEQVDFRLPASGVPVQIDADLTARSLTVEDRGTFKGLSQVLGTLRLTSRINDPMVAPNVSTGWDSTLSTLPSPENVTGFVPQSGSGYVASRVESTGSYQFVNADLSPGAAVSSGDFRPSGGITRVGSFYYALGFVVSQPDRWYIQRLSSTLSVIASFPVGTKTDRKPAIGTDGGVLVVAHSTREDSIEVTEYAAGSSAVPLRSGVLTHDRDRLLNLAGVVKGAMDLGVTRYVIGVQGTRAIVSTVADRVSAVLTQQTAQEFDRAGSASAAGFFWDGTRFRGFSADGRLWSYSTRATSGQVQVAYDWFDVEAHRTKPSPSRAAEWGARRRLLVDLLPPAAGTRASIYFTFTTSANLSRQTDLDDGVASYSTETGTSSGPLPSTTNTFPDGGQVGRAEASTGGFAIDGESNGSVGTGTFRASVRAALDTGSDVGWTDLPPTSSWTPETSVQYLVHHGVVYFRGQLNFSGTFNAGSTYVPLSPLPPGIRPGTRRDNPVATGPTVQASRVRIDTDGTFSFLTTASAGSYFNLAGITPYPVI